LLRLREGGEGKLSAANPSFLKGGVGEMGWGGIRKKNKT